MAFKMVNSIFSRFFNMFDEKRSIRIVGFGMCWILDVFLRFLIFGVVKRMWNLQWF